VPRVGSHLGWAFDHRQPLLRPDLEHARQFPAEDANISQPMLLALQQYS
jgi:hypothetical protein